MPTYDYVCDRCGLAEERFFHHPDQAPRELTCPALYVTHQYQDATVQRACLGTMHRQIGPGGGAIFRGPGFYVNDYKKARPLSDQPHCEGD